MAGKKQQTKVLVVIDKNKASPVRPNEAVILNRETRKPAGPIVVLVIKE
jgi:hypothetical protein